MEECTGYEIPMRFTMPTLGIIGATLLDFGTEAQKRRYLPAMLRGDELYVDARILKWTPLANVLGLHTGFELDRVSGRYVDLDDEQELPRTVFSLVPERPVDLFSLRRRFPQLARVVDAAENLNLTTNYARCNRPAREVLGAVERGGGGYEPGSARTEREGQDNAAPRPRRGSEAPGLCRKPEFRRSRFARSSQGPRHAWR